MGRTPRRPVNPPEPPPVEWCDHCERDVIEGEPWRHDEDCPRNQPEPKPHCSICNPRPDEHRHHGPTGRGGPVFCENHDREDWEAYQEAKAEQSREAIERERQRRGGDADDR